VFKEALINSVRQMGRWIFRLTQAKNVGILVVSRGFLPKSGGKSAAKTCGIDLISVFLRKGVADMAQEALNTNEIKRDYIAEMRRRQKEHQLKQDLADVTELNRRSQAVRDGSDRFYTEDEAEVILREIGFYD
jgi:hypothetical protein